MANSNGWGDGAANNEIGWGQGANNAIGWGDIHADSWAGATDISGLPTTDPDAQAFITAAAITDPTQQAAINTLVVDLKGYSLWTNMKAFYPFVGGTNAQHSWNLKNTAQFQISWFGGVTSSSNGVTVVTNGYGNTGLNMSTQISSVNAWSAGVYTNQYTSGGFDLGAQDGVGNGFYLSIKWNGFWGTNLGRFLTATFALLSFTDVNGTGLTVGTRTNSTNIRVYKEGNQIANSGSVSGNVFSNNNVFLGANNSNGTPGFYSGKRYACSFIYDGVLDATQNANLYTAVQAFQTTLGRQV